MIGLLTSLALAAPVQCEPLEAARILAEARVEEAGVARTHPWLVPGLALASPRSDGELRSVLAELCADGGELSVTPTAHWETAGWSAHSVILTRSETRDCILFERSIVVTIGVKPGAAARYGLQSTRPLSQTPVGECAAQARWYEEQLVAGEDGPVRLVLGTMREGDTLVQSEVAVRRATPEGWHEQVLAEPAPPRLIGGFEGPDWRLQESRGEWLVVQTHDRRGTEGLCEPLPGQLAWTWSQDRWTRHDTDAARTLLAKHGQWRLAGEPGWLLILAQDTDTDRALIEARARRLKKKKTDDLLILDSSDFPELNAGYLIVTPAPFPDRIRAEAARTEWGRRSTSYVKRAWPGPDSCE